MARARLLAATAAGLVAGALVGAAAYATIPGPDGTITGCYTLGGRTPGKLRVIDAASTSCKSGEQRLTWDQSSLPAALPRGRTVRGVFVVSGIAPSTATVTASSAQSFGFTFAASPSLRIMAPGAAPDASCPGTTVAPEAAPGFLCLYQDSTTNLGGQAFLVRPYGFRHNANSGGAAGPFSVRGSWAATSP